MAHIQSGLSQLGNLHAFAANNTNAVWVPASSRPRTGACTHGSAVYPCLSCEMVLLPGLLKDYKEGSCRCCGSSIWVLPRFPQVLIGMERRMLNILPTSFCCIKMFVHPTEWTQTRKSLKAFCHAPHFQNIKTVIYLVSRAKHKVLTVFIARIYLFLSRCVWLCNNILLFLMFPSKLCVLLLL